MDKIPRRFRDMYTIVAEVNTIDLVMIPKNFDDFDFDFRPYIRKAKIVKFKKVILCDGVE